jgi:hypothetical protein
MHNLIFKHVPGRLILLSLTTAWLMFGVAAQAQVQQISLDDLSDFRDPGKTWDIVGDVSVDLSENNTLDTEKGEWMLVNQPTARRKGKDLYTKFEHGDIDLELEYMIAKGSNSGIYLQGMYEVQLLDSWGKKYPTSGDNGGIYERWDESQPTGEKGYQGYPPRQNVSRAPGLWQKMTISFRAPRFDAEDNKIENARMLRIELNGVTIHEDVELLGPTRGAMQASEVARGPIRIQGDHGAVAFRNISYTLYDNQAPSLSDLEYSIYQGEFEEEPDYNNLEADAQGTSETLTSNLGFEADQMLIRYTGTMEVVEDGEYNLQLVVPGGGGTFRIDGETVFEKVINSGSKSLTLEAGSYPFELAYSKYVSWINAGLGLVASGPGIRETIISNEEDFQQARVQDPIIREANNYVTHRSFMRLPQDQVVTHAISVGSPEQLHYTYDLNHGTIVQAWRGRFLDATPMWYNRGNGTARPLGTVQQLSGLGLTVAPQASGQSVWKSDTTGTGFTPKGYLMDSDNQPTFRYMIDGVMVHDMIRVAQQGKELRREISAQQPAQNLYVRLAEGSEITEMENGMYAIDDKAYYLQLENPGFMQASVQENDGMKQLVAPLQNKVVYSILF